MLLKLSLDGETPTLEGTDVVEFRDLPLRAGGNATEADLETLLADNMNIIEATSDEDHTLLVIGRQVRTGTHKVMDLVALDSSGALTLIEVKRDARDVAARSDHAEIQAVRYAASLARLRTVDELVAQLYAAYIGRYGREELARNGGGREAAEWARRKLQVFIDDNGIDEERLNHAQKIVLVGAGFDDDTKSAAAWMAENGLPIRMIEVQPVQCGASYFLDVQQILPVPSHDSFYVELLASRRPSAVRRAPGASGTSRVSRLRMNELFDAGKVARGDAVWFKNEPDERAELLDAKQVRYQGRVLGLSAFGKQMSGWSGVNVYDWIVHGPTGKRLEDLRQELEAEREQQADTAAQQGAEQPEGLGSDLQ